MQYLYLFSIFVIFTGSDAGEYSSKNSLENPSIYQVTASISSVRQELFVMKDQAHVCILHVQLSWHVFQLKQMVITTVVSTIGLCFIQDALD